MFLSLKKFLISLSSQLKSVLLPIFNWLIKNQLTLIMSSFIFALWNVIRLYIVFWLKFFNFPELALWFYFFPFYLFPFIVVIVWYYYDFFYVLFVKTISWFFFGGADYDLEKSLYEGKCSWAVFFPPNPPPFDIIKTPLFYIRWIIFFSLEIYFWLWHYGHTSKDTTGEKYYYTTHFCLILRLIIPFYIVLFGGASGLLFVSIITFIFFFLVNNLNSNPEGSVLKGFNRLIKVERTLVLCNLNNIPLTSYKDKVDVYDQVIVNTLLHVEQSKLFSLSHAITELEEKKRNFLVSSDFYIMNYCSSVFLGSALLNKKFNAFFSKTSVYEKLSRNFHSEKKLFFPVGEQHWSHTGSRFFQKMLKQVQEVPSEKLLIVGATGSIFAASAGLAIYGKGLHSMGTAYAQAALNERHNQFLSNPQAFYDREEFESRIINDRALTQANAQAQVINAEVKKLEVEVRHMNAQTEVNKSIESLLKVQTEADKAAMARIEALNKSNNLSTAEIISKK